MNEHFGWEVVKEIECFFGEERRGVLAFRREKETK